MRRRLADMLQAVWGSVAFRLTLNYSLLALLTSLVSLAFIYHQTVRILESQFSRQVEITAQRMSAHFDQGGLPKLVTEITLELADHVNTDTEMFLLLDPAGRPLAGNIAPEAAFSAADGAGMTRTVSLRGRPVHGYLVARKLADGSVLVIGYDLRDLHEITGLIKSVSLAATGVIAILVLLGAYLFRRALQRRVAGIRSTAAQVGAGELTRRVPVHHRQDEFALLTDDINDMLDRIERLMNGVRNVSDAVAHHLRTPLTRILAQLRSAQRTDISHAEMKSRVGQLASQIEDLASVSGKLLQIAEFESGTRRKKFEPVRLDVIARDVVELYEAVAEHEGVELRFAASGPLPWQGDPDLLAGAVANLVDNALKYAGRNAHVRVTAALENGQAALTVADDGPGLPAGKRNRIGERFYRASSDVPGYGLGLATVIAIARLHGARLEFADGGPGFVARLLFPAPAANGLRAAVPSPDIAKS